MWSCRETVTKGNKKAERTLEKTFKCKSLSSNVTVSQSCSPKLHHDQQQSELKTTRRCFFFNEPKDNFHLVSTPLPLRSKVQGRLVKLSPLKCVASLTVLAGGLAASPGQTLIRESALQPHKLKMLSCFALTEGFGCFFVPEITAGTISVAQLNINIY